jgi:hypothetical protein
MLTMQEILTHAERLPIRDRWQIVQQLLRNLEEEQVMTEVIDWHAALRATYGILADDPIERPEQLPLEERELIE